MPWRCAIPLLLILLGVPAGAAQPAHAEGRAAPAPLILVSIDGFRADYRARGLTPALDGLAAAGASARGLRPSFPSSTYPNHYTLVTGKRPDESGVVANTMEDPALGLFTQGDRGAIGDRRWWDGAEPLWVAAERAGIRTAPLFWPGSEAAVRGVRPSYWTPFATTMPAEQRVADLLRLLERPAAERPGFLTLYLDDVDHAGHDFGPDAPETDRAVRRVDRAVGTLLAGLRTRGIAANVVVVSDHGMAPVGAGQLIPLDRILPAGTFRVVSSGAVVGIEPVKGAEAQLLRAATARHAHVRCWPKQRIPRRLRYGRNPRVPTILCLADVGWLLRDPAKAGEAPDRGAHGYDNHEPAMRGLFVAAGPDIGAGKRLGIVDNVAIAPLLRRLLRLPEERGRVLPILRD